MEEDQGRPSVPFKIDDLLSLLPSMSATPKYQEIVEKIVMLAAPGDLVKIGIQACEEKLITQFEVLAGNESDGLQDFKAALAEALRKRLLLQLSLKPQNLSSKQHEESNKAHAKARTHAKPVSVFMPKLTPQRKALAASTSHQKPAQPPQSKINIPSAKAGPAPPIEKATTQQPSNEKKRARTDQAVPVMEKKVKLSPEVEPETVQISVFGSSRIVTRVADGSLKKLVCHLCERPEFQAVSGLQQHFARKHKSTTVERSQIWVHCLRDLTSLELLAIPDNAFKPTITQTVPTSVSPGNAKHTDGHFPTPSASPGSFTTPLPVREEGHLHLLDQNQSETGHAKPNYTKRTSVTSPDLDSLFFDDICDPEPLKSHVAPVANMYAPAPTKEDFPEAKSIARNQTQQSTGKHAKASTSKLDGKPASERESHKTEHHGSVSDAKAELGNEGQATASMSKASHRSVPKDVSRKIALANAQSYTAAVPGQGEPLKRHVNETEITSPSKPSSRMTGKYPYFDFFAGKETSAAHWNKLLVLRRIENTFYTFQGRDYRYGFNVPFAQVNRVARTIRPVQDEYDFFSATWATYDRSTTTDQQNKWYLDKLLEKLVLNNEDRFPELIARLKAGSDVNE